MLLLAQYGQDGEAYHVASGKSLPLANYIRDIYNLVAPDIEPRLGEIPYVPGQVMFLGADITKLRQATGFVPEYTFREGIRAIIESIYAEKR